MILLANILLLAERPMVSPQMLDSAPTGVLLPGVTSRVLSAGYLVTLTSPPRDDWSW